VGALVSSGKATLHQLQTDIGTRDAYRLLEVLMVDAWNHQVMSKARERG